MRVRIIGAALFLFIAPILQAAPNDLPYSSEEIIVRFRTSVSAPVQGLSAASFSSLPSAPARALASVRATGLTPIKTPRNFGANSLSSHQLSAFEPLTRTFTVRVPVGTDIKAAIAQISADPAVEVAEPDYLMRLSATPNDTTYNLQWHLKNTGQVGNIDSYDPTNGIVGADVDAEIAWDAQTGASSMIVAVIDSGLDITHPDLSGNLWVNTGETALNGLDDDSNGIIDDVNGANVVTNTNAITDNCGFFQGHGTHVSGIVGALGNNGVGVTGTNWDVQLMGIKVAANDGFCSIQTSDIVEAINYAVAEGADVINMSLGGPDSVAMHAAADAARTAGLVLVAAAGNEGTSDQSASYPAAYSSVIGVAATDRRDGLASFSNFGSWVSLAAPGVAIRSAYPVADGSYAYESGTSMASPLVAGIAALVRSEYPALTPTEVEARLLASCETISATGVGSGRINAARSLLNLTAISPISAPAGQVESFTLTGVAFHTGITVRITKSGSPSITATNLNISAHDTLTCDFTVPVTSTGIYNVQITIGQTIITLPNAVTFTGLSVTSVLPSNAPNTGPVSLDLTGFNFQTGISFSLQKSGQATIPGTSVVINSVTSADADFDITGVAGGRWDVVVTSGSFSNPLSRGFAVTTALYQVVTPPTGSDSQYTIAIPQGNIQLDWPAGATASAIEIDINATPTLPVVDSNRDPYFGTGIGVDLEQVGFTPTFNEPFRLTLPYLLANIPDPTKLESLTIAYYNTGTQRWEPIDDVTVDTVAGTVSGSADHFTSFQIVQHAPAANLDKTIAYPNPFRPDRGHDRIVFDFLTSGTSIKVFDVSGTLIRELDDEDGDGRIDWLGVTNEDGDRIASGIYYYLATGGGQTKSGRVAVVR